MSDPIGKIQTRAFTGYGNPTFEAWVQRQSVKTPDQTHKARKKHRTAVISNPPVCILIPSPSHSVPTIERLYSTGDFLDLRLSERIRLSNNLTSKDLPLLSKPLGLPPPLLRQCLTYDDFIFNSKCPPLFSKIPLRDPPPPPMTAEEVKAMMAKPPNNK
jgi:hypothetical protein